MNNPTQATGGHFCVPVRTNFEYITSRQCDAILHDELKLKTQIIKNIIEPYLATFTFDIGFFSLTIT